MKEINAYIGRIRNARKQQFARDYLAYIQGGQRGDFPDYSGLSQMAAQGVWLTLDELIERTIPREKGDQ